ncbi:hypothetical protein [Mycobacterium persicum]|nr:hypothetical protein [Mycobacterium persicum]
MVIDPAGAPVLVPIGRTVTEITDAQARRTHSFLAAMPGYVLEATLKTEAIDWFSATKRRKTNVANGRKPGAMPGFRRKDSDQRFVCWFNGGRNAVFTKTGRRAGMETISGANPPTQRAPGLGPDGKPHKLAGGSPACPVVATDPCLHLGAGELDTPPAGVRQRTATRGRQGPNR